MEDKWLLGLLDGTGGRCQRFTSHEAVSGRIVCLHHWAYTDVLQVRADRPISSSGDSDSLPLLHSGSEWRKIYARSAHINLSSLSSSSSSTSYLFAKSTLASPAMGHWCPSSSHLISSVFCLKDFHLFNVSCHFRATQTLTDNGLYVVSYPVKNTQAYSFVTVYCMNFIIFLCVTFKLFSLRFVPLLAPNPGDATAKV